MTREHYSSDHHELVGVELGNVSPDEDEPRYAIKRLSPGDVPQELRELPSSIQHYTDEGTGFCIFDPPSQNVVQSTNVENSNNVHVGNVTVINNGVNIYRDLRSPSPHNVPNLTDTCNGSLKKVITTSNNAKEVTTCHYSKQIIAIVMLFAICCLVAVTLIQFSTQQYLNSMDDINTTSLTEQPATQTPNRSLYLFSFYQWGGRSPAGQEKLSKPASIVIIKHTATASCADVQSCFSAMQLLQDIDVGERNELNIRYNFVIGAGDVYEGRGWGIRNAQMDDSIDIAFMGNFETDVPSVKMLAAAEYIIQDGISANYLNKKNLRIVAHNQTEATLSPGVNIYKEIMKWKFYSSDILK